jgi:hypothetical protein
MIQGRGSTGFLLESSQTVGIVSESWRQNLDRNFSSQLRITRAIDLAHPTSAHERDNLEMIDPSSGA